MSESLMETEDIAVAAAVAVADEPFSVESSLRILNLDDADIDLLDLPETKVITALYDLMEGADQSVSDEAIADVIGFLESKYKDAAVGSAVTTSFQDCLKLTKFTFKDEPTESLIKAIQHFQLASGESKKKPLVIKCGDIVTAISRDFFELKLCQTVDCIYQHPDDYSIDSQYSRILNVCLHSKLAFRYFYKKIAQTMIEHKYPENIQTFLDQFVLDIRIRTNSIDEFCRMYAEDLYFYVRILTESSGETQTEPNYTVKCLLVNLKGKELWKFVVLTTHFNMYGYLLKEEQ